MRTKIVLGGLGMLVAGAVVAMCATTRPPAELRQARAEYVRVAQTAAADLAPEEMDEAKEALRRAETAYEEHGDDERAKSLAYVALRRVQLAATRADQALADHRADHVRASEEELAREFRADMARELEEPGEGEEQPDWEAREHRIQAEAGAPYAVALLQEIARVHRDDDGYVVTLPAHELFDVDDAEIRSRGVDDLERVDRFLAEVPDAEIEVVGHTDALGTAGYNEDLSRRRADAVRMWLVMHGFPGERISATGRGEMEPIDSNDSEIGRQANERIDIVVWPAGREEAAP
ncbi:MAG: OmpA family protein [Myxococcota bacterium]